jgi:hypothetical protein
VKGDCHFNAFKLSLTYSKFNEQLPGSVVMRTVERNNKLIEKFVLYLKKSLNVNDRKAIKLHSYSIETSFYRMYSNDIKGLKLPKVYYIHENVFQN